MAGDRTPRVAALVALAVVLSTVGVAAVASPAAASGHTQTESAFVVDLAEDGSATVSLTVTFDLTTDSERQAFEALRENTTARQQRAAQFGTRMDAIATRAESDTGREMAVRDPSIAFATRNDTGVVTLAVTWAGLAAEDGDRLVLSEPFTDDFAVDRPFSVVAPDGYQITSATPSPAEQTQTDATWAAGSTFENFEVTVASGEESAGDNATGDDGPTGESGPGFGIAVGAVSVLAALLGIRRFGR